METPNETELNRLSNYFVGKVVTMFVANINWDFKDSQMTDYFVGRVDYICELGIWLTHPTTLSKNFYTWTHLIGFAEEQVLKKDDPNYDAIMDEYEKKMEEKKGAKFAHREEQKPEMPKIEKEPTWLDEEEPENKSPFVDVNQLSNLAKKFKEED